MKRVTSFFYYEDIDYLKKLPGKLAEYLRIAVHDYVDLLKGQNVSASKSKGGGSNE